MSRRVPPHNQDAESSVLGAVLLHNDAFDRVELVAEDFYDPRHREVFAAMARLRETKIPIDPVTLETELNRQGKLQAVGGLGILSDFMSTVPTIDNVEVYAGYVRDTSLARRTIIALSEVIAKGFEGVAGGPELVELANQALDLVQQRTEDGTIDMPHALKDALAELQQASERKAAGLGALWGVTTGFADLDQVLGGYPVGVLTVIAARPGMGKSSLMRQSADAIATDESLTQGAHSFTLEDVAKMLALRTLSQEARVALERLRALEITQGEMRDIGLAAGNIMNSRGRWLLDDSADLTVQQIKMRVRRHKAKNSTRAVFIDYAQLVRPPESSDRSNDEMKLRAVVKGCAALARQEKVAVVLASQLNRDCEDREDKRPTLRDMRGSGALEETADVVMFLYRDDYYDPETEHPGIAEVIVAKNKHGSTGTVRLAWQGKLTSFRPLARRDH